MSMSPLKKWPITLLCLTVSLNLFMISVVEFPELSSNAAWEWNNNGFSVRTVSKTVRINPSTYEADQSGTIPSTGVDQMAYSGNWFKVYLDSYDTNDCVSPCNVRISASVVGDTSALYYNPTTKFALALTSGYYDNFIYQSEITNSIINCPISNPDTDYYWLAGWTFTDSSQEYSAIWVTITYDIYYRDSVVTQPTQPTQAPFTLPDDWTNNTTQDITYNTDVIPTYTTAVNIEDVTISDYDISENTSFMSAILSTLQGFSYTYNLIAGSLPYWWAIVIGLALVALIAWLLH